MSIQFSAGLNKIPSLILTTEVQKVARKLERVTARKGRLRARDGGRTGLELDFSDDYDQEF
jgi:hypothetical protein